ncbi:MAG: zf-HC2 domain-containing protein [Phycisphaerales bacterium]
MNRFCPDMQDRIVDYMLGALEESEVAAVEEHLAGCEGCRRYLQDLRQQGDSLAQLGRRVAADMDARQDRAIEALEAVAPSARVVPVIDGFVRIAVAAALVLGAGVAIGRLTAPKPVDVERLRADLESSIVASLKPAVQESILAGLDERLAAALAGNDTKLRTEVAGQISRDLESFASRFASDSEQRMDKRFDELIEVIEAARLTDRRRVAQALEQIKAQTGAGLRSVAALTGNASSTVEN